MVLSCKAPNVTIGRNGDILSQIPDIDIMQYDKKIGDG
jgi:hypothetical protein